MSVFLDCLMYDSWTVLVLVVTNKLEASFMVVYQCPMVNCRIGS